MPDPSSSVRRIAHGALQATSSAYAARLINLVVSVLLLNLLRPEEFGQVDLAVSLLAMLVALRDLGLHFALLHEHDRVDELAPTHFVLSVSLGALSTFAAVVLAFFYRQAVGAVWTLQAFLNPAAGALRPSVDPIVGLVLVVFAVFDLFKTAALTAETQLRRDLEFGRLALAHASATITAALVGLITAHLGGGAWALVFGFHPISISYVTVYCALVWARRPPPLNRLREFDAAAARKLIGYGIWYWIGGIPKTVILHVDKLIIGTLLGVEVLGLYGRAHAFAQMPTGAVTLALVSITGAVYARYHKNRAQLSGAFRRTQRLILRASVPISMLLVLEAPNLIRFFKAEWEPLVPILQWLIVYSLCRPVLDDLHALLLGVGTPRSIVTFVSVQAILLVVLAPYLTWKVGAKGMAIGMDLMAFIGLCIALRCARRFVDFPIIRTFAPPLLAAGVALAVRLAASGGLAQLSLLIRTIAGGAAFLSVYAAALFAIERKRLVNELQTVRTVLKVRSGPV